MNSYQFLVKKIQCNVLIKKMKKNRMYIVRKLQRIHLHLLIRSFLKGLYPPPFCRMSFSSASSLSVPESLAGLTGPQFTLKSKGASSSSTLLELNIQSSSHSSLISSADTNDLRSGNSAILCGFIKIIMSCYRLYYGSLLRNTTIAPYLRLLLNPLAWQIVYSEDVSQGTCIHRYTATEVGVDWGAWPTDSYWSGTSGRLRLCSCKKVKWYDTRGCGCAMLEKLG